MSTLVYAVRHGETEWNRAGRQQGHLDSPLTPTGIRQAELLAEGLACKKIEALYSSDLGRAIRTAEIIAKRLDLEIRTDARLRERNLGILQGLTRDQFELQYPEESSRFNEADADYAVPGGESLRRLFDRCVACAEEIAKNNRGKSILIVGHGGVLRSFFHKATRTPPAGPRRFSLFNAAINLFRIAQDSWTLETWGEIAHLRELKDAVRQEIFPGPFCIE